MVDTHAIDDAAVATSSPMAKPIGDSGHVFLPPGHDSGKRQPWSNLSVEAGTATLAGALSTGLVWADMKLVKKVRQSHGVRRGTLVSAQGRVINL